MIPAKCDKKIISKIFKLRASKAYTTHGKGGKEKQHQLENKRSVKRKRKRRDRREEQKAEKAIQ